MFLRGIDFGYCWDMSGVRGFFGEGYLYHKFLRPFGLRFKGSMFMSKTTTLNKQIGNMPMKADGITPKEFKPRCIKVDFRNRVVLNAVALSGPGAQALFEMKRWQELTKPFGQSFMSIRPSRQDRLLELSEFLKMLAHFKPSYRAPIVFQQNFTCPNSDHVYTIDEMVDEALESMAMVRASFSDMPQVPKFNIEMPVSGANKIAASPYCDALCVSNTVKWGNLPDKIDWKSFFDGTGISPLAHLGGGGLSGAPLLVLVMDWLSQAIVARYPKPIVAGGGILEPDHATLLLMNGAAAISVGSMSILAPWNMQRTINRANSDAQSGTGHWGMRF